MRSFFAGDSFYRLWQDMLDAPGKWLSRLVYLLGPWFCFFFVEILNDNDFRKDFLPWQILFNMIWYYMLFFLARLLLGREMEREGELTSVLNREGKESYDFLLRMIDEGRINEAEERLFDLLETASWEDRQKAALAICFYDAVNEKEDEFLEKADFSRDEIMEGLEDAMKAVHMEIPEYLRI